MFVEQYFYAHGDTYIDGDVYDSHIDRSKTMTLAFNKAYGDKLFNISTSGPTAFLYAAGPAVHNSDVCNSKFSDIERNAIVKSQLGNKVYSLASKFDNITYVDINADTCASSLKAIFEAEMLMAKGIVTEVIIYSENVITNTLLMFFKQLHVELNCGDGVVIMHLTKDKTCNSVAEITDTRWMWHNDPSAMTVTSSGYSSILNSLDLTEVDTVKPHGSGTARNDMAENTVIAEFLPNAAIHSYKQSIGHTQGASGLIEICKLIEDVETCNAIVLASGLGAFYGACRVIK